MHKTLFIILLTSDKMPAKKRRLRAGWGLPPEISDLMMTKVAIGEDIVLSRTIEICLNPLIYKQ
jgi:hypothetical protein